MIRAHDKNIDVKSWWYELIIRVDYKKNSWLDDKSLWQESVITVDNKRINDKRTDDKRVGDKSWRPDLKELTIKENDHYDQFH